MEAGAVKQVAPASRFPETLMNPFQIHKKSPRLGGSLRVRNGVRSAVRSKSLLLYLFWTNRLVVLLPPIGTAVRFFAVMDSWGDGLLASLKVVLTGMLVIMMTSVSATMLLIARDRFRLLIRTAPGAGNAAQGLPDRG